MNIAESIYTFYSEKKYQDKTFRLYQLEIARLIHSKFRKSDLILSDKLRQYTHHAETTLVFSAKNGFLMVNNPQNLSDIADLFFDISDIIGILTIQLSDIDRVCFLNWNVFQKNDSGEINEINGKLPNEFTQIQFEVINFLNSNNVLLLSEITDYSVTNDLLSELGCDAAKYLPNNYEILFGSHSLVVNTNLMYNY
jgi:hypothetical protein